MNQDMYEEINEQYRILFVLKEDLATTQSTARIRTSNTTGYRIRFYENRIRIINQNIKLYESQFPNEIHAARKNWIAKKLIT